MKIIFLDVDGVLNSTQWEILSHYPENLQNHEVDIDPSCVKRVKRICDETGAKIVLSSDWRIAWEGSLKRLNNVGFDGYIIDKTPEMIWTIYNSVTDYMLDDADEYETSRGREIDMWLEKHPEVENYLILDDITDFTIKQRKSHFIHINSFVGITDKDMEKGIEILKRKE